MLNPKSLPRRQAGQIPNPKQIPNSKFQNSIRRRRIGHWLFGNLLLFGIWCLVLGIYTNAYALNLDNLKANFLKQDYKSAILEGERLLASYHQAPNLDELHYFLGLCYLKDGNYLRASDIFEIVLREFKDTKFKQEAMLGLGDTYFLRGDFSKAQECYKELTNTKPNTKLNAQVYYRLSQIGFKRGDMQLAKEYLDKLKQYYPLNLEARLNKDLYSISNSYLYYTVQVGSFSSGVNAKNLAQKLINAGYSAYTEEASAADGKTIYRVRVGKLRLRQEACDLEKKLFQEGYPTKIYP